MNTIDPKNTIKILGQEYRRLLAITDYLSESNEQLETIGSIHATEIKDVRNHLIHVRNKILNTKEDLEYGRKIDRYVKNIYPKEEGPSNSKD